MKKQPLCGQRVPGREYYVLSAMSTAWREGKMLQVICMYEVVWNFRVKLEQRLEEGRYLCFPPRGHAASLVNTPRLSPFLQALDKLPCSLSFSQADLSLGYIRD